MTVKTMQSILKTYDTILNTAISFLHNIFCVNKQQQHVNTNTTWAHKYNYMLLFSFDQMLLPH